MTLNPSNSALSLLRARFQRFGISSDVFRVGVLISILAMLILGYWYWGVSQKYSEDLTKESELTRELVELRGTFFQVETQLHAFLVSGSPSDGDLLDQTMSYFLLQQSAFLERAKISPVIGREVPELQKILSKHFRKIQVARKQRGRMRLDAFLKTTLSYDLTVEAQEIFNSLTRFRVRLFDQTSTISSRLTNASETFSRLLVLAGSMALFFLTITTLKVRSERRARKHSEELLRDSQRHLELALDSGRVAAWNMQLKGNHLDWQVPRWERLGIQFKQTPKHYSEFLNMLDAAEASKWKLALAGALFEGHKIRFEFVLVDGSEQTRHILTTGEFFPGSSYGEGMVQGTMIDITEIRQASAKLESLHLHVMNVSKQFQAIIEGTDDPICALNRDMKLTAFNSAYSQHFKKICGVDVAIGMSLEQSLALAEPSMRAQMIEVWRRALQEKSFKTTMEFQFLGKDLVFEASFNPLMDSEGKHIGAALIARDITERKQFEDRLEEERMRAEEANAYKDRFVATVSHELRTPLNAILGFSELLMQRFYGDESARIQIEAQRRAGKQLLGIVGDLLDLSSLQKGQSQVRKSTIVVDELLSDLKLTFENVANKKNVALKFIKLEAVPAQITSDPIRLKQIVSNLISNALKFTAQGEVIVELGWVEPKREANRNRQLRFRVTDQGIGIPRGLHKSIFEPFSRGTEATNEMYPGTGLGLAIAKNFAELLGGTLELESSFEGKGSVFIFTFDPSPYQSLSPLLPAEFRTQKQVVSKRRPYDRDSLKGERILVVEDAPDLQLLLRTILEGAGASVTCTDRMQQGVHFALNNKYDYILCDIELPDGSGTDLVRTLRRSQYNGRIIAQTGKSGSSVRGDLMTAGFDEVLVKPFSPEDLVHLLESNSPSARELH